MSISDTPSKSSAQVSAETDFQNTAWAAVGDSAAHVCAAAVQCQTGLLPCLPPAGHVGRPVQAPPAQAFRREARAVALAAHHDDLDVVPGRLGDPRIARRIEAPLEHGAVDDDRTRQLTGLGAL